MVDFSIALLVLFGMMWFYKIPISLKVIALPLLVLLTLIASLSVAIWLAAINVKYRDVKYALPFLVQAWMYATPVVYSTSLIPEKWRIVYGLNPMAGVVDGFRWALLGQEMSSSGLIGVSIFMMVLLLVGGLLYFQRMERTFADII